MYIRIRTYKSRIVLYCTDHLRQHIFCNITRTKKFGAFLFLGFALAAFLNVSTIGAAIFGVVFAVLYFMLSGNMGHTATVNSDESEEL